MVRISIRANIKSLHHSLHHSNISIWGEREGRKSYTYPEQKRSYAASQTDVYHPCWRQLDLLCRKRVEAIPQSAAARQERAHAETLLYAAIGLSSRALKLVRTAPKQFSGQYNGNKMYHGAGEDERGTARKRGFRNGRNAGSTSDAAN